MDLSGLGAFAGGLFEGYNTEQDEMTRQALKNLYIQQYRNQQAGDVAGWNALQGGFQPGSNTGYGPSAQGGGAGGPLGVTAQAESSGRNIPQQISDVNTAKGTPGEGYYQIIDPTWAKYGGLQTGFKSAIQAPLPVQTAVASRIPIAEFGPRTQQILKQQFPWIDPRMTLGQAQQQWQSMRGQGEAGGPAMGRENTGPASAVLALKALGGTGQGQAPTGMSPAGGPWVKTAAGQTYASDAQGNIQPNMPAPNAQTVQNAQFTLPGGQQPQQGQPSALEQAVKRIAAMHLSPAQSMAALRAVMPLLDTQSKLELQQIMMGLREQNLQQRERYQDESLDLRRQAEEDRKAATEAKQRLAEAKFAELKTWRERTAQDAETKWAQTLQIKNADQRLRAQAQIANQLRQATQQKISALNAEVNAAGLAMDDETRQKFVDEAKSLYDETEKKIQELQKRQPEQGEQPATSAGTVGGIVQPQAEAKPKMSDEQKTALKAQAKAAIARTGNPDAVRAKYKELTGEDLGE